MSKYSVSMLVENESTTPFYLIIFKKLMKNHLLQIFLYELGYIWPHKPARVVFYCRCGQQMPSVVHIFERQIQQRFFGATKQLTQ